MGSCRWFIAQFTEGGREGGGGRDGGGEREAGREGGSTWHTHKKGWVMDSRSLSVCNDTLVTVSSCHCEAFLFTMTMDEPYYISTIHIPCAHTHTHTCKELPLGHAPPSLKDCALLQVIWA